ncbi:MAG: ABC transporter permease [Bifidobacterium adolescentis]
MRANLLRRKSRTILTVLGVIVGCSIVLMISIGQGISEQNEQMLKSMGNLNDITVTAAGGAGRVRQLWRYVEFVFVGHDIIGSAGQA